MHGSQILLDALRDCDWMSVWSTKHLVAMHQRSTFGVAEVVALLVLTPALRQMSELPRVGSAYAASAARALGNVYEGPVFTRSIWMHVPGYAVALKGVMHC